MQALFRKILIVVLFIITVSCGRSNQQPFSFVQICDPQLGMGGYKHDLESFQNAVNQINGMNPDFVIICGDLVEAPNDSSYADFNKIRSGFNMPCYCVPGNHDTGNIPSSKSLEYYRKTVGNDYFQFQNKGYGFVGTNTQLWKSYVEKESDEHDNWFRKTLKELSMSEKPIFVFGHYPLFEKTPDEKEFYFNLPAAKRDELLTLFANNNVKAYLSGHAHKTVVNNCNNVQLVSGGTLSVNFDKKPLGFRLWEVSADTIKNHFVALKSFDKGVENTKNQ